MKPGFRQHTDPIAIWQKMVIDSKETEVLIYFDFDVVFSGVEYATFANDLDGADPNQLPREFLGKIRSAVVARATQLGVPQLFLPYTLAGVESDSWS